ncbi:MAG: putative Ig domain-containing protein [Acidobacteria bacterium]|nr:putative Ig domain-containing protein [Acidobacteriota bacterium]
MSNKGKTGFLDLCALVVSVACGATICDAAIPQSEREALIRLYESTNGSEWIRSTNWLRESGTEKDWYGVVVYSVGGQDHVSAIGLAVNGLRGPVPSEIGDLSKLKVLNLAGNRLTGAIPVQLTSISTLWVLELQNNFLEGGIPSEIGALTDLALVDLSYNQLSGNIPASLGNLSKLATLSLGFNRLSGNVPLVLAAIPDLHFLQLQNNQLGGIASGAHTVPILAGLAAFSNLIELNVSSNRLVGEVPPEILGLVNLLDDYSDLRWNALYTHDDSVRTFLNTKQKGGDWDSTQTLAPTGLSVGAMTSSTVQLAWDPVSYLANQGGYSVYYSRTSGGPYAYFGTTSSKAVASMTVTGLSQSSTYYLVVRTRTDPHSSNSNVVESDNSSEVSVTTSSYICPPITLGPGSLPEGQVGTPYAQILSAAGGIGSYAFTVTQGHSPDGLSLDPATGVLSGTPTASGVYDFAVTATDSLGCTGSQVYAVSVHGGECASCPIISRIKSRRAKPGTPATLVGSGFSKAAKQNRVTFGQYSAKITKAKPTKLTVIIPRKLKKGQVVDVTVTVGVNTSAPEPFVVK